MYNYGVQTFFTYSLRNNCFLPVSTKKWLYYKEFTISIEFEVSMENF
jgi:hypothetical protein